MTFRRLAAVSGLVAVALILVQGALMGQLPAPDDPVEDFVNYVSEDNAAHQTGLVLGFLIGIPLVVFVVGVFRDLQPIDRVHDSGWATLFLVSAVLFGATVGVGEGFLAVLVYRQGEGLDPELVRALFDASQLSASAAAVWLALMFFSVAVAVFGFGFRQHWYGWMTAVLGVAILTALIDTVSTSTNAIFSLIAFASFLVWTVTTCVLMYRDGSPAGDVAVGDRTEEVALGS